MKIRGIRCDTTPPEEVGWIITIDFVDGAMISNESVAGLHGQTSSPATLETERLLMEGGIRATPAIHGPTDMLKMIGYLINLAEDLRAAGKL